MGQVHELIPGMVFRIEQKERTDDEENIIEYIGDRSCGDDEWC